MLAASLIGTTIEWYDFFLYGTAAALVFGKLFFPGQGSADRPAAGVPDLFAGLRGAADRRPGVRPFRRPDRQEAAPDGEPGADGRGQHGDGPAAHLQQIGVAAPVLLAALRFVQGFAVGGEWGGAVLMAGEFGDAARRGSWAGWPQVGVPAGNLLPAGVLAAMAAGLSEADFLAWGWRVAFLISGALVAVGWWVRSTLSESPQFEAAEASAAHAVEPAPAIQALKHRPGGVAIGAGLKFGENVAYYLVTTFAIAYLAETVHAKRQIGLNAVLIGSLVELATMPLFSALSDRIGRRPVYAFGALAMAAWGFVFLRAAEATARGAAAIVAVTVALVLHGAMYGPQAAFISELFPTRYRYSGVSIAYQVTSIFAGSLAPVIAVALLQRTGSTTPIAAYLAVACIVSAIAALTARETRGLSFAELDAYGRGPGPDSPKATAGRRGRRAALPVARPAGCCFSTARFAGRLCSAWPLALACGLGPALASVETLPCHGAPTAYRLAGHHRGREDRHGYLVANLYGADHSKWLATTAGSPCGAMRRSPATRPCASTSPRPGATPGDVPRRQRRRRPQPRSAGAEGGLRLLQQRAALPRTAAAEVGAVHGQRPARPTSPSACATRRSLEARLPPRPIVGRMKTVSLSAKPL